MWMKCVLHQTKSIIMLELPTASSMTDMLFWRFMMSWLNFKALQARHVSHCSRKVYTHMIQAQTQVVVWILLMRWVMATTMSDHRRHRLTLRQSGMHTKRSYEHYALY
uniref:Uncharacterized protein n=1 Tax=Aegilops tauschii subsp. strangulata TaxID=200361 RepID=A0A453BTG0_AEGTS